MHAFYADHFVLPLPEGHRFPMAKYRWLRDEIMVQLPDVVLHEACAATPGELTLVHAPHYVEAVTRGTLGAQMQREIGFPWSPEMVERSLRSVGASLQAARSARQQGIAANLAGGTHHAYADKGGGFCVFNDLAVAARVMQVEWLRQHGSAQRPMHIAIVDLDVHQGNGTAAIFANDPTVFTLSMHGDKNFPFRKEASDWDVALPDGCDDTVYLSALDDALVAMSARFEPDMVLYLAGADPHEGDRLGRLKLSTDGMRRRDARVFEWAFERRLPLAFAMGGGYGTDLKTTVVVQLNTYREALKTWLRWQTLR